MPGEQEPPYEVLAALVASLRRELADAVAALGQARAELAKARERIAELEARLMQNPRNSSRPPWSEVPGKPAPGQRSLRKKSGRRPGGQDGHKGTTLAQVARPDREIRHDPGCCCRCGAGLAGRPVTAVERRQVFGLQPVRAEVTGHQLIERECGCGHRAKATAPDGADPAALAAQVRLFRSAVLAGASQTAARQFCAIRSYLSTAAKHGLSFFDALVMLAEGVPWMPAAA